MQSTLNHYFKLKVNIFFSLKKRFDKCRKVLIKRFERSRQLPRRVILAFLVYRQVFPPM